jgi:ribosome biogenesis GTPase
VPIDETLEDPSMNVAPAGVGRRPDLDAELAQLGDPDLTAARVLAQHRGRWLVAGGDEPPKLVAARGRLRGAGERAPTTGDWVAIDADGVIASVLERRGTIVRRAAGSPVAAQVLAANVELVLVVEPLPEPNERRAERIVALAQAGGVAAALVLTKADLDPDGAVEAAAALARRLGVVDGLAVSVHDEDSIAPVAALLEPGSTTVLLGPSGAGKSTLVNALLGFERQATGALSSAGDGSRGRHTTVTRDLLALPSGALLIDTPGIREAGLWDGGVSAAFADIEALALRCRFADCAHENEPGCAVRAESDPERVDAWRKLEREQAWIEDRRAAALARESAGRSYRRIQRDSRRMKGDG